MHAFEQIEYSDVALWFNEEQIQDLVARIIEAGMRVAWKETKKYFTLSVQAEEESHWLTFRKVGTRYRLRDRHYNTSDPRFEKILQHFIEQVKGHAVIKMFTDGQLVVQKIRYGEAEQIIKISGASKEVIFEKECSVSMEEVMEALRRHDAEERIPALTKEVDYELAVLYEAMGAKDIEAVAACKEKLAKLHHEMIMLEV
ncbi:hypothetical protein [Aneurinibacillus aneurinilyticus]|jgi:hypothetical protein|uniref:Uncharacterized protein n=2 Tax=Aneurinibacillus aneurinilyticus TaxID=1391 RepID=A0A848CV20_ANEAE|nr:hypothetical protein [Aneurinibacillus aneurinilyticus]ERI06934.1 hypothetical protein HMPREF0083_04958 [Aneurinibacillus aneurinilyticus ATCC 12856]MCI1692233.1 hypothetical protein [Aneurinibacillus aneurinilyticus]MED0669157.1 hypothetical protein [Aneurinibacillus aneurinilyticus]MED0707873.1 hypothetical protein [Aneurinibacillus aneurinilyticus]MED0722286.1 hypothetical protein [Aneurinibacillus aneurinilyticus]